MLTCGRSPTVLKRICKYCGRHFETHFFAQKFCRKMCRQRHCERQRSRTMLRPQTRIQPDPEEARESWVVAAGLAVPQDLAYSLEEQRLANPEPERVRELLLAMWREGGRK